MNDKSARLYAEFLDGDVTAIEELVRIHSDNLIRFAYLFVKDSAAAEDIAEDSFATLIVKRKSFSPQATFKTYLYRIARNKCLDFLRRKARTVPLEDVETVLQAGCLDSDIVKRNELKKVYRCLNGLPEEYRDVLYLAYFDGFSVAEICKVKKKNAKQTYNLLARAKARLKEKLMQEGVCYEDV